MSDAKQEKGRALVREIFGAHGENALAELATVAPDLTRQVYEHAYGDIYTRDALSLRDRSLATIAGLTALGYPQKQLAAHIRGGMAVGLGQDEIVEAISHMALYAGYPAAINAALTAKTVFDELETQPERAA